MGATWVPDAPRVFNLGLRRRDVDHETQTVTLELASDEALLTDYAALVEDNGARPHQGSVRGVVDYVLGKIGAGLSPGGPDADVTAYWPVTNVIPNPTGQIDASNWQYGSGASVPAAITMSSPLPPIGNRAITWNVTAAGDSNVIASASPTAYRVTPGKKYVFAVYIATGTAPRNARAVIQWWADAGSVIVSSSFGALVNSVVTTFRRLWVIAEAPPGAQYAYPYINTQGNTVGQSHYVAEAMLYEGDELVPAFLGDTPDGGGYSYEWAGDPHKSPSTRTPVVDRPPETFIWRPGVTAWDFLQPFLTPVNLRLFCDELRVWRLIDPATYEVPGYVSVSPLNATKGVDTIARDDPDVFATGVVCLYAWTDSDGIPRTASDAAGTPEKVVVVTYPPGTAFPGPGAAARILARRNGTGRTQDVEGLARWETTPGMYASISLPTALEQRGKVETVEWQVDDGGLMSVGARGLIDIPPNSWLAVDPAEAWIDPPDITWIEWV